MTVTATVVVVSTLAFGVRWLVRRLRGASRPLAGTELVVLGIVAGPQVLGLASDSVLATVQPVISLLLGVMGFHMGLSLHTRLSGVRVTLPALISAGLVGSTVAAAIWWGGSLLPVDQTEMAWVALAMGAVAAASSDSLIGEGAATVGATGHVVDLMRRFARVGAVTGVLFFGGALAFARASTTLGLTPTEWLATSLAVGLGCGVLHHLFMGRAATGDKDFVATIGVVVFSSGMAAGMDMSPLLVTGMAGIAVALLSSNAGAVVDGLVRVERPTAMAVLVAAGLLWAPPEPLAWTLVGGWLAVRAVATQLAPRLGLAVAVEDVPSVGIGRGLLVQGPVAVAIAVNAAQVSPTAGNVVLTAALVSLAITDLLGLSALRSALADAGAIDHTRGLARGGSRTIDLAGPSTEGERS